MLDKRVEYVLSKYNLYTGNFDYKDSDGNPDFAFMMQWNGIVNNIELSDQLTKSVKEAKGKRNLIGYLQNPSYVVALVRNRLSMLIN